MSLDDIKRQIEDDWGPEETDYQREEAGQLMRDFRYEISQAMEAAQIVIDLEPDIDLDALVFASFAAGVMSERKRIERKNNRLSVYDEFLNHLPDGEDGLGGTDEK